MWGDLNWVMLFVNVVYVDQGLSALFEMCIFGGVLSDVNYEYLLIMLCEIIDRIGFEVGWYFWNFWKYLKKLFFKKVHYFWVWRLFFGVWGGFGEFDLFLGLGFDIVGLCFVFGGFFELFSVFRSALKPWYCIVVVCVSCSSLFFFLFAYAYCIAYRIGKKVELLIGNSVTGVKDYIV